MTGEQINRMLLQCYTFRSLLNVHRLSLLCSYEVLMPDIALYAIYAQAAATCNFNSSTHF